MFEPTIHFGVLRHANRPRWSQLVTLVLMVGQGRSSCWSGGASRSSSTATRAKPIEACRGQSTLLGTARRAEDLHPLGLRRRRGTCAQCCKVNVSTRAAARSCSPPRRPTSPAARPEGGLPPVLPGQGQAGHEDRGAEPEVLDVKQVGVQGPSRTTTWPRSSRSSCSSCPKGEEVPVPSRRLHPDRDAPPTTVEYKDFDRSSEEYREDWDKFDMWQLPCPRSTSAVTRAYSMANYPEREGHHHAQRPHRLASRPRGSRTCRRGSCRRTSSSLKPGDEVTISGPVRRVLRQGDRTTRWCSSAAARAWRPCDPTSSTSSDASRPVARSRSGTAPEVPARDVLRRGLRHGSRRRTTTSQWHVALSEPLPEDNWEGYTGLHPPGGPRELPVEGPSRPPRSASTTSADRR